MTQKGLYLPCSVCADECSGAPAAADVYTFVAACYYFVSHLLEAPDLSVYSAYALYVGVLHGKSHG